MESKRKMKKLIAISMLMAVLLSACGAQTPTTPTPDVLATANAAAATMIAQTQAAIPTATLIPPTDTALPSPTLAPTLPPPPTSSVPTLAPTTAPNANGDPCNAPLAPSPDGKMTTIKIDNQSSGPANVSLYLSKTPFGECGYRSFSLSKNGSTIVEMPQGCYSVYAWVNNPKKPSTASGGGCINNSDKWTFVIRDDIVKLSPP